MTRSLRNAALTLSLLAAALGGCQPPGKGPAGQASPSQLHLQDTAQADGLSVTLKLPQRVFVIGPPGAGHAEKVDVTLIARNLTEQPKRIVAPTGTYCIVRLWRNTRLGWEQVKTYPQSALHVQKAWTLPPGGERTFHMTIPVEPDWPTALPLRMTGELNGAAKAVPMLSILVEAKPGAQKTAP